MNTVHLIAILDKLPPYATLEQHGGGKWWIRLGYCRYISLDDMIHNRIAAVNQSPTNEVKQ